MPTKVKTGQIYLPTGYEGLQKQAESKRRIADTLWQSGMQGTANPTSIVQVLGDLAQVWSGKRMGKKADELEIEAANRMGEDYRGRYAQFQNDAQMLTPDQMVAKYGADPLMQDALKPYTETMTAGMKDRNQLGYHDGQTWGRKGDVAMGSVKPNDPNSGVIRDQQGNWIINPVATTGAIARQGIPIENGTYSMRDPALGPTQQQSAQSGPMDQGSAIGAEQAMGAINSLGPQASVSWMKRNGFKVKVSTPEEAARFPSGTPLLLPDGTEGEVP